MIRTKAENGPAATAILLVQGPLRQGVSALLTGFVYRNNGRIVYHDQYVDREKELYFARLEWALPGFTVPREEIGERLAASVAEPTGVQWRLYFSDDVRRMAIFASKLPHCLYDILARCRSGEWKVEIPLIISNHPDLEPVARQFGVPFHCFPIAANKQAQEQKELALLREHEIEFIVLARYMQILSRDFVAAYPEAIINIHHAFLPSFPGPRPYHAAYQRGVKIIGATSHYVTEQLDAGPIIEQDVTRVSHVHPVEDLIRIGRDLEKIVLARAIWHHIQRKILVYGGRVVIFN